MNYLANIFMIALLVLGQPQAYRCIKPYNFQLFATIVHIVIALLCLAVSVSGVLASSNYLTETRWVLKYLISLTDLIIGPPIVHTQNDDNN